MSADDGRVTLRCAFEADTPPRPHVDVLLALPRPKVMRRLWAQLAALGVGQIILTNAERVERHYFDTHILDEGLLPSAAHRRVCNRRAIRGCRWSRFTGSSKSSSRIVWTICSPTASVSSPTRGAHDRSRRRWLITSNGRVLLAIGPEGGWNDFELALLAAHGFQIVGLGPRTLRVDTACTALLAITHASLTD